MPDNWMKDSYHNGTELRTVIGCPVKLAASFEVGGARVYAGVYTGPDGEAAGLWTEQGEGLRASPTLKRPCAGEPAVLKNSRS